MQNYFDAMHQCDSDQEMPVSRHFNLNKIAQSLQFFKPSTLYNIIYFDAFAPSKQEEMWHIEWLEKVVNTMKAYGVFVTYCAKGQLKRDLKSLGLEVETLPGPPGKKEMVRAIKQ
jgi:tRNA U34 5-methylaminomethyl-2-thiouridine-forming methyltransferase MnmC